MQSVWQTTLSQLRIDIESRSMPGCGAVAAVSAADGLALVLKGLRFSYTSDQESDQPRHLVNQGDALIDRFETLADEDVAAFQAFLAAQQDKKHSPESDLQDARRRIIRVPLDTAHACLEGLDIAYAGISHTKDSLRSDTRAGAILLHAGLRMMLLNIEQNMSQLDADQKKRLADEKTELESRAESLIRAFD